MKSTFRRFLLICLFEAALGVVAWLVGLLVGYSPLATLYWSWESLLWGGLGTAPLIGGLLWLERAQATPFVKVRRVVEEIVVPMFCDFALWQLAIVALLAGAGEEILFRGLIQGGLVSLLNFFNLPASTLLALFLASLSFGLLHPLTKTYALLCMLAGLYLGGVWLWSDNLVVPILIHAFYDFFALVYLLSRQTSPPPDSHQPAVVAMKDNSP